MYLLTNYDHDFLELFSDNLCLIKIKLGSLFQFV